MSDEKTPTQSQSTSEELIAVRREKLAKLKELGLEPYGAAFETTTTPGELKANFNDDKPVKLGGATSSHSRHG